MDLPTGTVTLVFTDIQDSSEHSERYRASFEPLRAAHFRLLREAVSRWNGREVSTAGDALFVAFVKPQDAVQWAIDVQRTLARHDWPMLTLAQSPDAEPERVEIRIRIGMHTGEPYLTHNGDHQDYFGPVVNRAARVSSAAYGGQVIISDTTHSLVASDLPEEITFRDCGIHRLKGVGEDRLWQLEAPDLLRDFPALKTLDPLRHNLPISATPYLGREEMIESWLERLRDPKTHVLTLTGFAGMGKTRSALHLAELSLDEFADGVWWVDASEARTGEEMMRQIADALRLPLLPTVHVRDQVTKYFRERTALLILDNLEQVADAGKAVKELLLNAPGVKFLVTSRRTLEIQAERVVDMAPLSSPESMRLFVNRVRDRQPSFEITEENAADIAELCKKLDGIPLAIELAASRAAMMAPRQMLLRLTERFKLLQTRSADIPERQRTLRTAIDWSYDLLSDEDKSLFAQVSVFAGGFTLEDAEAVCEAFDVLEGIAELRRQSLLRTDVDAERQETRFAQLASLREYGLEKLNAGSEGEAVRLRHARYFLGLARDLLAKVRTSHEADALRILDLNSDNLRAGMEYALEANDIELYAGLGLALGTSRSRRGFSAEALLHIEGAIAKIRPLGDRSPALLAELLAEWSWVALELQSDDIVAAAQEAMQLFAAANQLVGQGKMEALLGFVANQNCDYAAARAHYARALELVSASKDGVEQANIYSMYGVMEFTDPNGSLEEAASLLQKALRIRTAFSDVRGQSETLTNLGALAFQQREWNRAWECYLEALHRDQQIEDGFGVARSLYNLAEVAEVLGDQEKGLRLAAASERLMDRVKSSWLDEAEALLKRVAGQDNRLVEAIRREARALTPEALVSWALET